MEEHPDKVDIDRILKRTREALKDGIPTFDLKLTDSEILKLRHELEVYMIELNMIQQELTGTKKQLDDLTDRYDDFSKLHDQLILHVLKWQNN
jgi:hypothetical protein